MTEPLTSQLLGEETPAPHAPFQFLEVNGFVYRCNRMTGEMWRLEAKAGDKKIQVWKLIESASEATH
jgi:hypothetical protein